MPSVFFSWRPKLIRMGKKPTEQSVTLANNSTEVIPHNELVVSVPSSSNIIPYINESDYGINQSIALNEIDMFNNETPKMTRAVRFSEGVGNNSTSSKPIIVTNRPPSIVVQGSGSNVAPQNPLETPVQHVGPPNRSSWNQTNTMTSANDSLFNRLPLTMAPLAAREETEENIRPPPPPRPSKNLYNTETTPTPRSPMIHQYYSRENRANVLLQQLRADDGAQSESDVSANEVTLSIQPHSRNQNNVIFLQYNDEVKRSQLPSNIRTVEQIKGLFLRSFPNLSHYYLNLPHVKVYIQEPSKGQLFYELDDVREIKDKSVLKIREQNNTGYQSPPPVRFTDHPPPTITDYVSEPEIDDFRDKNHHLNNSFRMRPASAVPGESGRMYNINSLTKPTRSSHAGSTSSRYDSYYDPYSSDTSSQGPRSGSVTPIIDKETRFRMDTMERQLAGLSSLVHSALVSKGVSESTQKDMLDLRRQILEFHPEVNKFSNSLGKEPHSGGSVHDSTTSSFYRTPETHSELSSIKKALQTAQHDVKEIKRAAQLNIQNSKDIMSDTFQQIQTALNSKLNEKDQQEIFLSTKQENLAEKMRKEHLMQHEDLQTLLRTYEANIENIRKSVLNSNRKLRMTEVEQLTNNLTKIGRQAAKLKTQFPELQREIEKRIKEDMERVVREQNFIKEETNQIDSCLRRCKTLANMMVTMKKLAMVQDPAINSQRSSSRDDSKPPLGTKSPVVMARTNNNNSRKPPVPIDNFSFPPVPTGPKNYEKPSSSTLSSTSKSTNDSHVLDTILDELNSPNNKTKKSADVSTSLTCKVPPPIPPQRNNSSAETIKQYNSPDIQTKLGTKNNGGLGFPPHPIQQTNALFDNNNTELNRLSAISSTESINSQEGLHERAAILTSNKERIDDKQRELNNQLEKLQKLCPTL